MQGFRIGDDVESHLSTLEIVKGMKAKVFVPAHGEETDRIEPLAQYNIDKVYEIAEKITAICKEPLCFEYNLLLWERV